eukprot:TRINITY_DN7856_c0_g1_i2.p1 TRINITY_DN7856_c0_g1~~TRINITY_DN7856_c0_g1_i2.p1  ORF type:complete len:380 (-),score=44.28 TRINITY_DN7856_c0_g1_i2:221-1270(-)
MESIQSTIQPRSLTSLQETTSCLFQSPSSEQRVQSPPPQAFPATPTQIQPQYKEWNQFLSHLQRHCAAQTAAAQAQSNPSSFTEDRVIVEDAEMKETINVEPVVAATSAADFQDQQQLEIKVTNSVGESSNVYQGISQADSGEIEEDESMEEGTHCQSAYSLKQRATGLNGYHCGKSLTYDLLKNYFDRPLKQAACDLGVCTTTLKRACRKVGIAAWPARQVRKLNRSLKAASNTKEVWSVVDDYVKRRLKQHGQLRATDVENLVDKCFKHEQNERNNQIFSNQLFQYNSNNNNNGNTNASNKIVSGNAHVNFQRPLICQDSRNRQVFSDGILQAPLPLVMEPKKEMEI